MNSDMNNQTIDTKSTKVDKKNHKFDMIAYILCFISAFCVWLFVMHSDQTVIEKKIVVTVDVADQVKKATEYDIISQNDGIDYSQIVVELTVSGTKKALEKYSSDDFKINVKDLDNIKSVGVRTLLFDDPELPGGDIEIVHMSPGYLSSVFIDVVDDMNVKLDAGFVGRVEDGIKIDDNNIYPILKLESGETKRLEDITIKGPKSIIDSVGKVKVIVDVSGSQKSAVIKSKTFEFYDKSGVQIDNNYNYIKVELSEIEVQVTVEYENKSVPIDVFVNAEDKDRYKYEYTISYNDGGHEIPAVILSGNSAAFPEYVTYTVDVNLLSNYTIVLKKADIDALIEGYAALGVVLGDDPNTNREIKITITKTEIKPDGHENNGQNENTNGADSDKEQE